MGVSGHANFLRLFSRFLLVFEVLCSKKFNELYIMILCNIFGKHLKLYLNHMNTI